MINSLQKNKICQVFIILIALPLLLLTSCNTQKRVTNKRINKVENSLLEAVSIKGMPSVNMNILDRMEFYRVPGLSIAIIDNFKIEWIKAYGFKDITRNEPLLTDTLFQAGRISQSIAALCALRQVEKQKIGWNDDVNQVLKSWKIPGSRFTREEKITLFQLLTHTAGLSEIQVNGFGQEESLPGLADILRGRSPANHWPVQSISKPGERRNPAGSEYVVLQQILEDLENSPFSQIAYDSVFTPLNMNNSIFTDSLPEDLHQRAAQGHLREGNPIEGRWRNYPELAISGLWTTPQDLAFLLIELMKTAQGESQKILSPRSVHRLFTPHVFNHSFGWTIDDEGEKLIAHQSGAAEGYHCHMLCYPLKGQGAVLMANSSNGIHLIEEILRSLSKVYKWPHFFSEEKTLYRLEPSIYSQYVGKYEINPNYMLTITHEDYYLIIEPTGQSPTNFYVENPTSFFSTSPYIHIRFVKNAAGQVTGLVLNQAGVDIEARKIE